MTQSELHYEASCAINESLLSAADIGGHEHIEIYNVANGEHFAVYAIQAERELEVISVNGASSRKPASGRPRDHSQLRHPDRVRAEMLLGPYRVYGCTQSIVAERTGIPLQMAT